MLEAYCELLNDTLIPAGEVAERLTDPVGIGAVGGSGTRLLLQILSGAGVAMAGPINRAGDAIEWPPLKQLLGDERLARLPRAQVLPCILQVFEDLLIRRRETLGLSGRTGWKVPETFHWLPELAGYFPDFQYLHLVRHGLDMAYSGNQNQVEIWAPRLDLPLEYDARGKIRPHSKLEYWLRANEATVAAAAAHMPGRMLVVRFEDLCRAPQLETERIFEFLGIALEQRRLRELAGLVKQPGSVGRYLRRDWASEFSDSQLARLAALGYPVS